MFYEQLKPNRVISHCKCVLKYTHQFLPADISQASASARVSKLLFQTSFMFSSNCLLFPYFLTKLSKKKKKKKPQLHLFKLSDKLGSNTSKETAV